MIWQESNRTSRRTRLLLAAYVISGFAGLAMAVVMVGLLLLAAFGQDMPLKIDPWPWFPGTVLMMIAAKCASRWSLRKDVSDVG